MREADQSWIYGDYVCLAGNELGMTTHTVTLLRASKCCEIFKPMNLLSVVIKSSFNSRL